MALSDRLVSALETTSCEQYRQFGAPDRGLCDNEHDASRASSSLVEQVAVVFEQQLDSIPAEGRIGHVFDIPAEALVCT